MKEDVMSDLTRAEIQEFWDAWLATNREAERSGDWRTLADHYAEDATYGWMYSPDEHFMAVGRDQIRDWAIGIEMDGLDGWRYDYQASVIDEQKAMIVGFWKQKSGILDDDGAEYEILGLGGSWFGVERQANGEVMIAWQRDWFDMPSTAHTFMEILKANKAPETLLKRMSVAGHGVPGSLPLQGHPLERLAASGRARRLHRTGSSTMTLTPQHRRSSSSTASSAAPRRVTPTRSSTRQRVSGSAMHPTARQLTSTRRSPQRAARSTRPTGRPTSSCAFVGSVSSIRRCSTTPTSSGR